MAKGWLDNYGKEENYNDSKTTAPQGYVGDGYSNVGRNYSPAWGGQFQGGGSVYPVNYVPQAQNGKRKKNIQDKVEDWLGHPMQKAEQAADEYTDPGEDQTDNIRHPMAGRFTSEAIQNKFPSWMQYTGIPQAAGFLGGSVAGLGHELIDPNRGTVKHPYSIWDTIKEGSEDQLNNMVGAAIGSTPFISKKQKSEAIKYLSDNNLIPDGYRDKDNMYKKHAMGGSIPGAVGFSYARTQGIPSKADGRNKVFKTDASAQEGVKLDMYGAPITAIEVNDPNASRTIYDARTNRMILGSDTNAENRDKAIAHENYHASKYLDNMMNYDIAHHTDNEQWARMQAQPSMVSTDNVWGDYYDRKPREIDDLINSDIDSSSFLKSYYNTVKQGSPSVYNDVVFDTVYDKLNVNAQLYQTPGTSEGEAQRYENTGIRSYKNGGWLNKYDVAQEGTQVMNARQKRGLELLMKDTEDAKKDAKELHATGKIKHLRSTTYKKSAPRISEVRTSVPQSATSKAWEVATHPMTAAGYAVRHEDLPDNFSRGPINAHEQAVDIINPFFYANEGKETLSSLSEGHPLDAAGHALNFVPAVAEFGPEINQGLKAAGKVLGTEEGLLSNAYKLNPYAERLNDVNKSYRVAGLDALEDFQNTGVLRSVQQGVPEGASLTERAMSRPTGFPSFQKGYADMRYAPEEGAVVFETALPTFKRGQINPVTGFPIKGRHYAHRVINPETGATMAEIPASDIRVFGDKPHWLQGYKEIPKPTSNFESEINWGKWNKEIPDNPQLMKEYDAIEKTTKANNTWMKNPDGSPFQGTPEQFVQQNSENFKKYVESAKGNYNEVLERPFSYHGSSNNNITEFHTPQHSDYIKATGDTPETGIFLTNEKSLANTYATKNKNGRVYELYAPANYAKPGLRNPNNIIETNVGTNIEKPILTSNLDLKDVEYLKSLDYTGIADYYLPNSALEKTVFDSNIIKSATGNNGMFDMTNPNIYKTIIPGAIGLGALGSMEKQKEGGVIKDDRGQWGEHKGQPTRINQSDPNSYIDMGPDPLTGIPLTQPLLGISDKGERKIMYPGEKHKYKKGTKYVDEFPIAKNGMRQEQKGLVNLDQLTNFTNYNTKQPGGWLDIL